MADSPELPLTFPRHVNAEKQIRNPVCGHRVTEPIFSQDQPLITEAAKNAGDPLVAMLDAEQNRREQERAQIEMIQRHRHEIRLDDVSIQEAAKENLLHARDDRA